MKKNKLTLSSLYNEGYEYQNAGENAQPEVQEAIARWRELPEEERTKTPLLYWLLGEGTPDYKMSKEDSNYTDNTTSDMQSCDNCEFIYKKLANEEYICSQIEGKVKTSGWCKLWKQGK